MFLIDDRTPLESCPISDTVVMDRSSSEFNSSTSSKATEDLIMIDTSSLPTSTDSIIEVKPCEVKLCEVKPCEVKPCESNSRSSFMDPSSSRNSLHPNQFPGPFKLPSPPIPIGGGQINSFKVRNLATKDVVKRRQSETSIGHPHPSLPSRQRITSVESMIEPSSSWSRAKCDFYRMYQIPRSGQYSLNGIEKSSGAQTAPSRRTNEKGAVHVFPTGLRGGCSSSLSESKPPNSEIVHQTSFLRILKSSFIEMSYSLSSNIEIVGLYQSVMGLDDTQQDATEVRGRLWDILKKCITELPDKQKAAKLESLIKSQFEGQPNICQILVKCCFSFPGVLYELSDKPGESRQHPMDFFTLDLILASDSTLLRGLNEMATDAHGSYSRYFMQDDKFLIFNRSGLVLIFRMFCV